MTKPENQKNNYCHILLTRFNVPANNKKYQKALQSENWLKKRFNLFENFCLPSVVSQTHQKFYWLIYFDEHTPLKYKDKVLEYRTKYPFLNVKWVSSMNLKSVQKDIHEITKSKPYKNILTTRLDNDDAISNKFFTRLYDTIKVNTTQSPYALNCTYGIIFNGKKTYKHQDDSNAFISLYEPINEFQTVWAQQHIDIIKNFDTVQITHQAMWLQIIHIDNISNRVKGTRVSAKHLKSFNINEKIIRNLTDKWLIVENITLTPLRIIRERLIKFIKTLLIK